MKLTVSMITMNEERAVAKVIADIRRVTQRNADSVGRTRGSTVDLIKQAQTLTGLMNTSKTRSTNGARSSNGRRTR